MQASRFEQKYLIREETAQQVRDFVQSYLELDENGVGKPDFSYPVHSLYLDSEDFKLYWSTINGDKNRFKLRLRFYNDNPDTPVFFEIKRRMNNCIMKQRGGVRREAVSGILAGQLPPAEAMVSQNPKHIMALQHFCGLVSEMQARPKVHVAYLREAYVPPVENSARLTLDRLVHSEPDPAARLSTQMHNPIRIWGNAVVLELKFTNRYPNWFGDLVREFNLQQCGAAKYADGVTLMSGHKPNHRNKPRANRDLKWGARNDEIATESTDQEATRSDERTLEPLQTR